MAKFSSSCSSTEVALSRTMYVIWFNLLTSGLKPENQKRNRLYIKVLNRQLRLILWISYCSITNIDYSNQRRKNQKIAFWIRSILVRPTGIKRKINLEWEKQSLFKLKHVKQWKDSMDPTPPCKRCLRKDIAYQWMTSQVTWSTTWSAMIIRLRRIGSNMENKMKEVSWALLKLTIGYRWQTRLRRLKIGT